MAKKKHRFQNLAAKIRSVRESLGLSQDELAEKFKRTRGAIAQWEMEDDRRTEPTNEQLFKLAHMTDRPLHTVLWFMNDSTDVNAHVEYEPDGTIHLRYTNEDLAEIPDDIEEMKKEWEAEEEARRSGPGKDWVALVLEDPAALDAAYRFYQEIYPKTARKTRAEKSASVGLIVREFEEKDERTLFQSRSQMFVTTVLHFLSFLNPDSVGANNKSLGKGSIRLNADYWDGRALIQFAFSRAAEKRLNINDQLGHLFVMERMIGRSVKKMLVVCTDHPAPNSSPMILGDVNSCRLMGVNLLVAHVSNPQKTAEVVSTFLKSGALPGVVQDLAYQVPPSEAFLSAETEKPTSSLWKALN
jgi:transcriptional regulator with XRE-family HTH domain